MATIKAFSDVPQSKVLAGILPIESADMYYPYYLNPISGASYYEEYPIFHIPINKNKSLPCWSLAALLDVLPKGYSLGNKKSNDKYNICMTFVEHDVIEYDNPVDVCYKMILELHEKGLL